MGSSAFITALTGLLFGKPTTETSQVPKNMNAQFRQTTDKTLVSLLDPTRGYVYTCLRCSKHIKEEAVAGHVCEAETITVQGVKFVRDASMRYACQVCAQTVPIVLVRAHALRHPQQAVDFVEEEWRDFGLLQGKRPTHLPSVPAYTEQKPAASGRKRRRDCSEVLLLLRKVRKVGLTLGRSARALSRALAVAQKRAFRHWTKSIAAN